MCSQYMLLFMCLVVAATAMNLKHVLVQQQAVEREHKKNVLYFQPHDEEQSQTEKSKLEMSTEVMGNANGSCPDQKHFCSSNYTCCKGSNSSFACCPFQKGVCCPDGKHCCPPASRCDMAKQMCFKQNEQGEIIMVSKWNTVSGEFVTEKTSAVLDSVVCPGGEVECADGQTCCKDNGGGYECCPYTDFSVDVVKCSDGSSCPDSSTCCQLSTGRSGCCPIPKAVCCSDHTHCCPNGYKCDTAAGTCTKGNDIMSWLTKLPAIPAPKNEKCKDGSECPSGSTCCETAGGRYGCCPLPQAVCCSDHTHCCPSGYKCDVSAGTCSKGNDVLVWYTKFPSKPQVQTAVVCPGGQSQCPDGYTCCKMSGGEYGCCPYSKAVCCSDHIHCCPLGYKCDVAASACVKESDIITWLTKIQAAPAVGEIKCKDGSECPTGNTCCKGEGGKYGCCPVPKAVCCSDHTHCCPKGYRCDVSAGTCVRGRDTLPWLTKVPAIPAPENEKCKDGSECPSGSTCCEIAGGRYGCCPLPEAVCCSDHTHCCPSGYTCDTSAGTCSKGNDVLTWFTKVPAKPAEDSVTCKDGSQCPNGNTCCELAGGRYGCCPLPRAVCCSDHTHCCPNGYTCDTSAGTCSKGNDIISWLTKVPAIPTPENEKCKDGSECPSGSTCCEIAGGRYGCCPLPQAVCCSDHTHCCPNGYKCDTAAGTCSKGSEVISWLTKIPSIPAPENEKCKDGSECPSGSTCCEIAGGRYGCCPLPQAVCCSDHTHCCPNGYKCDTAAGTCSKGSEVISWLTKIPAIPAPENEKCKDGSECPSGSTCCEIAGGRYGCCPLPQAVCCSDHTHCCPNGYTCDTSAGTCSKGNDVITWFTKVPAKPAAENVMCKDGSQCPSGNTCCEIGGGRYGCCPLSEAVCCSDHTHCCPNGYTCDTSSGKCNKGNEVISWFTKTSAVPAPENVMCKDGSQCPSGNTCCELGGGRYGCCPLPEAVCCSDHTHCCPNGYTCDTSSGKCNKGNEVISWFTKTPATRAAENVMCKDGSQCPSGNTCCEIGGGRYGCCPLPQAVCCSDHTHCCPNGYTCDTASGKCNKGNEIITWFTKVPALPAPENEKCKDGSECPSGNTCCEIGGGRYGCCPLPQAVCCSDHTHCCPNGYTCDTASSQCHKGDKVITWFTKTPATRAAENVMCKDGSQCPSGNTCCEIGGGRYGCCPLPEAVCCSDHTHCCPNGYTCDTSSGKCNKGNEVITWITKTSAVPAPENVMCKDGSQCPSGNTCCELGGGRYGCCPLPEAVCCSDHTHCCPNGYTCDTASGKCNKGNEAISWFTKTSAVPAPENVMCKDGSQCPSGNTCCELGGGRYGCCPLPEAVCCSDHTHCCPNGYTCDTASGKCNKGNEAISWFTKTSAVPAPENVMCKDGSQCPSGNTCCELGGGRYGCCPLPEAVCCSDHTHCCPNGYTCDTASGKCNKGNEVITWFTKTPATRATENVMCKDGSQCPSGNTCCELGGGRYGCCPLPEAVCCSDHTHCCPNGYTCDTASGKCNKGNEVITWFTKTPATRAAENVMCKDGSQCPSGNTCCELGGGRYGCCPLPEAVCCSDHTHCCPNGYTCDTASGKCNKGNEVITWFTKTPATRAAENVMCKDGSQCPSGNTCCELGGGRYGCCPLPEAVCCSDHTHCCPNGYTCDTASGKCNKGNEVITWFTKTPATRAAENVMCKDGSQCPSGNTCCELGGGRYGCCPLPEAVCCSDHTHCCPNGYTCDTSSGKCNKGDEVITWFTKTPATRAAENVMCKDGSQCPSGNTCCELGGGRYGCCPLPEAVCCSDHTHCCPNGYTCDTSAGTCSKGNDVLPWLSKVPSIPAVDMKCEDNSLCPDHFTCCKTADGGHGCCQYSEATCCSDGAHCCPKGFECNLSAQTCDKEELSIPFTLF